MTHALVGKWGKSLAIRVPLDVARAVGLSDGEAVEIEAVDGSIHIRRSAADAAARRDAAQAVEEIKAAARGHTLSGISIRELIEEGAPRVSLVLDASMALAWLFEDEATEAAYDVLERVSDGGAVVPALWHLETANVLHNAARRGRCDTVFVDRSLASLAQLPIAVDEETCGQAWSGTLALARSDGLTVYDAAYLELAQRKALPLASCDRALVAAAWRLGISVMTLTAE